MEQKPDQDYQICFENDSTSNYLVLKPGSQKRLLGYQVQMLLNNSISGLLEFHVNYIGDNVNFFYDVTSKCSLVSFMSRKRFTRYDFLKTMLVIINSICNIKNFLLNDNNLLLDETNIYVDLENMRLYFIYMPVADCKNDFQLFFINMIVKLINFQDEESDNYLQKILDGLKSEYFSLTAFKRLLEELLGQDVQNIQDEYLHVKVIGDEFQKTLNSEDIKNEKYNNGNAKWLKVHADVQRGREKAAKILETEKKVSVIRGMVKIPHVPADTDENCPKNADNHYQAAVKTREDSEGKPFLLGNINGLLILQIVMQPIFITAFALMLTNELVTMSDSPYTTAAILVVIFLAVDVLLIRLINEKKNTSSRDLNINKTLNFITQKMREKDTGSDSHVVNAQETKTMETFIEEKGSSLGETVILGKPKPVETPYLKEMDGQGIIKLDKKSILVGRMGSFVDHVVSSTAVGKVHAELINEENEYFIIDSNSRNGTFINDERLKPNTKVRIGNNDVIRFANKEYVFINGG